MNDETSERLKMILVKEHHCGFVLFLAENLDGQQEDEWSVILDEYSCQWNLLVENEKSSWDILAELQGGRQEMMRLLRRGIGQRGRKKSNQNRIGQYERRVLKLILEQRKERSRSLMNSAIQGSEAWSWARADVFAVANIKRYLELKDHNND